MSHFPIENMEHNGPHLETLYTLRPTRKATRFFFPKENDGDRMEKKDEATFSRSN